MKNKKSNNEISKNEKEDSAMEYSMQSAVRKMDAAMEEMKIQKKITEKEREEMNKTKIFKFSNLEEISNLEKSTNAK